VILNDILARPPEPGHRITFARLDGIFSVNLQDVVERAGEVAGFLHGLGVRRGDRIGIHAANCLEWVLLDLAALWLGAVTAGLEPGKFEADPALLGKYDLKLLFTDRPGAAGIRAISELGAGTPPRPVRYEPGDVTALKFTSGSTGEPKAMAATAGSVNSSITAVQDMFQHTGGDNLFVFLPLSLLQQRYWVYSALRYGHDVTISTYEAAFPALRRVEPTVIMGVPGFYETARKQLEGRPGTNLFGNRIRYLWTGSAPASETTLRFFTELGLPIYEGYGLNETCIVAKNHPGAHRVGSVGKVLPGKQVLLDEHGVLSIRCDFPVNTRYEYAPPGESERVFGPDGTVRTGDLGYLDEDGFLFIRGRADDVIVLENGRKVIVRPLEEHLKRSPAIEDCVVLCPHQTQLVAVVSPARLPADEAAIRAQVADANATFGTDERIGHVVIAREKFSIDNGLLTSQFKPKRKQILAAYRAEIDESREHAHAR
jgi:long-chain acyl-CoA synthetase